MDVQRNEDGSPFVMWGDHKIELELAPLREKFFIEKAEKELRETPEVVQKAIQELRQLVEAEKDLHVPSDNDDFLLKFLRPCKFYPESALKKMQMYYKFRASNKEYCHDLTPQGVRKVFDHDCITIMSPRDQHGRRMMVIYSGERWNHREVPLIEVFRGMQVALESAMVEPRTQVSGVIVIFDMKGLTFSQVMQFTPSFAKLVVDWIQDCVPIRIKAVHIVHQPYIFNMVFQLFKPFLREKLRSRIHFHGSNKASLLAHVDAKSLRMRHGGDLPDPEIPGEALWEMLSFYEDKFILADSYGYGKK